MSINKNIYLGCYLDIKNWHDLAEELDIYEEQFIKLKGSILISNYPACYLYDEGREFNLFNLDTQECEKLKEKARKKFLEKHSKALDILNKHFKKEVVINFGLISYEN